MPVESSVFPRGKSRAVPMVSSAGWIQAEGTYVDADQTSHHLILSVASPSPEVRLFLAQHGRELRSVSRAQLGEDVGDMALDGLA